MAEITQNAAPLTSIQDETVIKQDVNQKLFHPRVWYEWCLPINVEENEILCHIYL